MILNTTTRKLQILLGATVAANQLPVTVDYVEFTSSTTTPALQLSTTNNTTAVDILPAPASSTQRKVNFISIVNKDTDFVNVTVRLDDNGTTYNYVSSMALAPNCTLQFTDTRGWSIIDSNGNILVAPTAVTDIQVFTANGTWTAPKGATYTLVDCYGGGGSGGGGTGNVAGVSPTVRPGGGGGGGGAHIQMQFLTAELTSKVNVTVAASRLGGAGGSTSAGTIGLSGLNSQFGSFLTAFGGSNGGINATFGGGGGGGASVTSGGSSGGTTGNGGLGGNVAGVSSPTASVPDYRGGTGGNGGLGVGIDGYSSYLGGGGGGGGSASTVSGGIGGSSYFSAAGGGGGGGINNTDPGVSQLGGAGGITGGAATTGGGGAASASINTGTASANGADGDSTKAGAGGAGGAANNAGTGSKGGDGGFPGGGGGGGGGGTTIGGTGGAGAAGKVVVISW